MKILHVAMLPENSIGILSQMKQEKFAASELGINWKSLVFTFFGLSDEYSEIVVGNIRRFEGRTSKLVNYFRIRYAFLKYLLSIRNDYDTILVRYNILDPFLALTLLFIGKKTFLVHHTKEVDELLSASTKFSWVKALIERILGAINLSLCKGVVGVTEEILYYENDRKLTRRKIEKFSYPNGVLVNQHRNFVNTHVNNKIPNILFVASRFYSWHGLDLLIKGLRSCSLDFRLHLVGDVLDQDTLAINNDERIVFHGRKSHDEIADIAKDCCCALGSFALERKGLTQACTLKVREYLALGLPVICGHKDVFDTNFPYFKFCQAEIKQIIKESYEFITVDKQKVMYSSCSFIDKRLILKKLYQQISQSPPPITL